MTDHNANRPGYKKTKVGWIPEEWEAKRLKHLVEINYGKSPKDILDKKGNFAVVGTSEDYRNGNATLTTEESIVIGRKGSIDNVSYFEKPIWVIDTAYYTSGYRENVPKWLYYYLDHIKLERFDESTGVPSLNRDTLYNIRVRLPSINEQKKIVEIMSTWDRAIEQTRQLIDAKQRLKKGLMQQLLTGRMRFPGFGPAVEKAGELPEGWEEKPLNYFLKKRLRKEEKPQQPFDKLGIRSHGKGIFINRNEDPNSYSMDYFYRVKENDIVVNITFAWEGAIAYVGKEGNNALVSHRFPTYVGNKQLMNVQYLKYLIHTNRFFYDLGVISPGGAGRNRVMIKSDFLRIKVKFPAIDEQKFISGLLTTLDNQIDGLKSLSTSYKQQKHGLMQKLLSGEVRV